MDVTAALILRKVERIPHGCEIVDGPSFTRAASSETAPVDDVPGEEDCEGKDTRIREANPGEG